MVRRHADPAPIIATVRRGTIEVLALECGDPIPIRIAVNRARIAVAARNRRGVGDLMICGKDFWHEIETDEDEWYEFKSRQHADMEVVVDTSMPSEKAVVLKKSADFTVWSKMVEVRLEYRPTIVFPKLTPIGRPVV